MLGAVCVRSVYISKRWRAIYTLVMETRTPSLERTVLWLIQRATCADTDCTGQLDKAACARRGQRTLIFAPLHVCLFVRLADRHSRSTFRLVIGLPKQIAAPGVNRVRAFASRVERNVRDFICPQRNWRLQHELKSITGCNSLVNEFDRDDNLVDWSRRRGLAGDLLGERYSHTEGELEECSFLGCAWTTIVTKQLDRF